MRLLVLPMFGILANADAMLVLLENPDMLLLFARLDARLDAMLEMFTIVLVSMLL